MMEFNQSPPTSWQPELDSQEEFSQEEVNLFQQLRVELAKKDALLQEMQNALQVEQHKNANLTQLLADSEARSQSIPFKQVVPLKAAIESRYPPLTEAVGGRVFPQKRLKICIVTQDIIGPVRNGGIGTAYYYAANFLRDCGHDVTIFYSLGDFCETGTIEDWVQFYAAKGITFIPAEDPKIPSMPGVLGRFMSIPRKVYEYLKRQSFDIVHASEWRGNVFYALLAKKLGLAFANTTFCIKTSSPTLWSTIGNHNFVREPQDLLRSYIERKSVEWGDFVISPSHHMLHWMEHHGYNLPKDRCYVQPNIMPISESQTLQNRQPATFLRQVKELVFFGRLESRKGLKIFCQALTKLEKDGGVGCKVVFLGKLNLGNFDAESYLKTQATNWSFPWEIITDYDALQALEYLKTGDRLAVVPSLLDNSPFTIYECLAERIPFICSERGGTAELIHEIDRRQVVISVHPTKLAQQLRQIIARGTIIARPSFDFKQNLEIWAQWHLSIGTHPDIEKNKNSHLLNVSSQTKHPLVSICLAHFNRPKELSQAIASIERQTYANYEVILVDDGSDDPEAIAYLNALEDPFAEWGWKIVRQENLYLGAVRNTGVRHAKGEYVLLMDDDNCAKPHELEVFVQAAQHSGADILTCFADLFEGEETPQPSLVQERMTPIGDCLSYGLFANCYGDSNSLIKREFFEKIGGFTEDYGVGLDDQEFFSRAILHGAKLFVIPEALYWYRISKTRLRSLHTDANAGSWRVFRAYMENVPWVAHDLFRLSVGLFKHYEQTRSQVLNLRNLLNQTQSNFKKIQSLLPENHERS
jgi:O-antigen biosynthesis protein